MEEKTKETLYLVTVGCGRPKASVLAKGGRQTEICNLTTKRYRQGKTTEAEMPRGTEATGVTSLTGPYVRPEWSTPGGTGKIATRARDAGDTGGRDHRGNQGGRLGSIAKSGETMKKWYSLIDKVYREDNLRKAYRAVRANNGAYRVKNWCRLHWLFEYSA